MHSSHFSFIKVSHLRENKTLLLLLLLLFDQQKVFNPLFGIDPKQMFILFCFNYESKYHFDDMILIKLYIVSI